MAGRGAMLGFSGTPRQQRAVGGMLPAGMTPSGGLTNYTPTLRERTADVLRKLLFSDDRTGQARAERVMDVASMTPLGVGMDVYDAGREAGMGNLGTAGVMLGMAAMPGPGPKKGIRAFHGSPHDFDKFDMSKIGTGEGAQAYGHGLYFSDNENVAKLYKDEIPSANLGGGRMYEVNISADPSSFLDLDKPLSQQSATMQDMARKADLSHLSPGNRTRRQIEMWRDGTLPNKGSEPTGRVIYNALTDYGMDTKANTSLSDRLLEAGIPGVKYVDGSRAANEGTRNYVVFDDRLIEIVRKYGIAGASAMLGYNLLDGMDPAQAEELKRIEGQK